MTHNTFKLILPNMNTASTEVADKKTEDDSNAPTITPQMKTVLDYLAEYDEISDEELQELLNIKKTRAYLLTRQMSEEKLIEIVGKGAAKRYKLSK